MKKEFLSYDLALKLKDLGFDEPCFAFYGLSRDNYKTIRLSIFQNLKTDYLPDIHHLDVTCDAPLWQQTFDWFREKYNFNSWISGRKSMGYGYTINNVPNKFKNNILDTLESPHIYESYEKARQACLEKLIELAKEQNVK